MQLPRILNLRFTAFSGSIIFILWLWIASDSTSSIKTHLSNANFPTFLSFGPKADAFNFPPIHSEAMRAVCEKTEWNSSLVFTCDNNHGGVGHVRNSILNCVRYAIGAGGALVMPNIALREVEGMDMDHEHESADEHGHNLGRRHGPGRKGMDYMFDTQHFEDSLRISCPELKLIDHLEPSANSRRRGLQPESLFATPPTTGIEHPEEWQVKLYTWIDRWMTHSHSSPIIVDLEQSFLQYPTHSDGHEFAHEFGGIMKFRPDVRKLATVVLRNMIKEYDLHIDLSQEMFEASFLGVHVRTEEDYMMMEKRHAVDAPYTHLEPQAHSYLAQASNSNLQLLYAASGNISAIQQLDDEAITQNMAVTSKYDLLTGKDRYQLDALKWDQRALVDYLVLLKASDFAGVGHSSFSWNVALKRHEMSRRKGSLGGGHESQRWKEWSDGISSLYGVIEGYVASSGCMWP